MAREHLLRLQLGRAAVPRLPDVHDEPSLPFSGGQLPLGGERLVADPIHRLVAGLGSE